MIIWVIRKLCCAVVNCSRSLLKELPMFNDMYKSIMDSEVNPLRKLPKLVRFQIMASLAYMWSVVFCIWAGLVSYVGFSIAAHTVLLIGIFFTADIFRRAKSGQMTSYDQLFRDPKDGCTRYDDVWGA